MLGLDADAASAVEGYDALVFENIQSGCREFSQLCNVRSLGGRPDLAEILAQSRSWLEEDDEMCSRPMSLQWSCEFLNTRCGFDLNPQLIRAKVLGLELASSKVRRKPRIVSLASRRGDIDRDLPGIRSGKSHDGVGHCRAGDGS